VGSKPRTTITTLEKYLVLKYESVKELQCFCGKMSVHYIYYLARWNFVVDIRKKNNALLSALLKIVLPYENNFCCNKHLTSNASNVDVRFLTGSVKQISIASSETEVQEYSGNMGVAIISN